MILAFGKLNAKLDYELSANPYQPVSLLLTVVGPSIRKERIASPLYVERGVIRSCDQYFS